MLGRFGMVQFARGVTPDLEYGFCLDDNARAFLAAVMILHLDPHNVDARELGEAALSFMETCQRPDGRFHNLMAADGLFTDEIGSPDSVGRLIWACGVAIRCAVPTGWRERAAILLQTAVEHVHELTSLRPIAYAALGLAAAFAPEIAAPIPPIAGAGTQRHANQREARLVLSRLCTSLAAELDANAREGWDWFEQTLHWGNARVPEALLRGAAALNNQEFHRAGMRSLRFLASVTHRTDVFVPIGNRGWYSRGGVRAIYDQQPIEACGMVDAWLAAARLTDPVEYESKALEAFAWFLGLNTDRLVVVDPDRGGCYDGLMLGKVNLNMGAESTLSYVHAHAAIAAHFRRTLPPA